MYGTFYDSPVLLMSVRFTSAGLQGVAERPAFFLQTQAWEVYGQGLYLHCYLQQSEKSKQDLCVLHVVTYISKIIYLDCLACRISHVSTCS
jgi:hypothetical protein